jgi:hypothetical protein
MWTVKIELTKLPHNYTGKTGKEKTEQQRKLDLYLP